MTTEAIVDEVAQDQQNVWNNIRRLDNDVADVKITVGSIQTEQRTQGSQLSRIENFLTSQKKWDWGMISVMMGAAALCGALVMTQINNNKQHYTQLHKQQGESLTAINIELQEIREHRLKEAFDRGKLTQKVDDTKERYLWLKDMLIKHLDDGHPDSVISLFNAKHEEQEKLIQELERIQELMSRDRFTGKEGDRMQKQLDSILEEQRDRTKYIPKEVQ